jgi:hypothetical protein
MQAIEAGRSVGTRPKGQGRPSTYANLRFVDDSVHEGGHPAKGPQEAIPIADWLRMESAWSESYKEA